jgi:hypothetical protein
MSTDREFNDKVSAKINAVGPCCSCLITIGIVLFGLFLMVLR